MILDSVVVLQICGFFIYQSDAFIVQWIERRFPEPEI